MAGRFKVADWQKIATELNSDPDFYGLPEGGREASIVLSSFNIRKLGRIKNRERELDFLATFCARCDLIAIQEVQDDLEGLRHLRQRMESKVAGDDEFEMVVSDITGEVPGESGMAERLAFIFRNRRVRRLDMASDLNIDRSSVLDHLFDNYDAIAKSREEFRTKMKEFKDGSRKTKPTYVPPAFITFIRSPHVVAFELPAANDQKSITLAAVNAHLIYGKQKERDAEFEALLSWLTHRLKDQKKMAVDNIVLLGDLNLNFDQPVKDRKRIEARLRELNKEVFGNPDRKRIYFPFIDGDPLTGENIRTNARSDQTFDQIAFFLGSKEKRLPNDDWREEVDPGNPDGFDYGVFNFSDLFARSIVSKPYTRLTKTEKKNLGKNFEHSVSDHPILPCYTAAFTSAKVFINNSDGKLFFRAGSPDSSISLSRMARLIDSSPCQTRVMVTSWQRISRLIPCPGFLRQTSTSPGSIFNHQNLCFAGAS